MRKNVFRNWAFAITLFLACGGSAQVYSDIQLQAKAILEKISGTKISMNHSLIPPIVAKLQVGDVVGAAMVAENHPNFLNVTVKDMALKMSVRDETMRIPLNDFAASFIGVVRDGTDARTLLTGNFTYVADPTKLPVGVTIPSDPILDMALSNNHYASLDKPKTVNGTMVNLDIGSILKYSAGQTTVTRDPPGSTDPDQTPPALLAIPEPAGVLTSRTFLMEHVNDGTNRRAVEFTFREFMCSPIANWADTRASDARVGRDVDRFPGGSNPTYLSTCKGCHSVMDGFRGAFARYDIAGGHVGHGLLNNGGNFDSAGVANKYNKNNSVFTPGYVTKDNSFINNAQSVTNAGQFGWRTPASTSGVGLGSFGSLIANSQRFSQCMVKRVYESSCRRLLDIYAQSDYVQMLATDFENNAYNLKRLFATVVASSQCAQ